MKLKSLFVLTSLGLCLVSCNSVSSGISSLHRPITNSDNNPLNSPRIGESGQQSTTSAPQGPSFTPGAWVEASMPNTTFFRKKPSRGTTSADKVLAVGTPLKVISNSGTYVRVELESGDVGFVPGIMVNEQGNTSAGTPSVVGSSDSINAGAPPAPVVDTSPPASTGLAPEPEINSIKPPSAVADDILPLPPSPSSGGILIDPNLDLEIKFSTPER